MKTEREGNFLRKIFQLFKSLKQEKIMKNNILSSDTYILSYSIWFDD